MSRLNHLLGVSFVGLDAIDFCQSQFTSNLHTNNDENHWYPSAWCASNGLVLATLLYRVRQERVDCLFLASETPSILARLKPFMIGRQVSVTDPVSVYGHFGPSESPTLAFDADRSVLIDDGSLGFADQASPKDASLEANWREQDILCAMAWLPNSLAQQFLPQSLGLEQNGGLSYQKGCYPGQEVIAKVHYRGHVKRQLVIMSGNDLHHLMAGMNLFSTGKVSQSENRTADAWVIDAFGSYALAVLSERVTEGESLQDGHGEFTISQWHFVKTKPVHTSDPR